MSSEDDAAMLRKQVVVLKDDVARLAEQNARLSDGFQGQQRQTEYHQAVEKKLTIYLGRTREALQQDAAMLDKAQAIMRKHGFRFETRLDLSEGFEKLAFTFYNLLVEVDINARRGLEGSSDE